MSSSIALTGRPPLCMQKFSTWVQYWASNSVPEIKHQKCPGIEKIRLTQMRWRSNWQNSKFRSVVCVEPVQCLDPMINKIVVAIIAVELQEEFREIWEDETFLWRLILNLYYPSVDRFSDIGIIEIGLCHDLQTRISVEVNLALWMNWVWPLRWKVGWPWLQQALS